MNKIYDSPKAALEGLLHDGMTIMSGGFGLSGNPESLIPEIKASGVKDLTVISNNAGADGFGLWHLLQSRQIRKMISSYIGENKLFEQQYLAGDLELELNPQGTLAERIRAGGAGIPAFYTRTGVGTLVAEGKPVEEFDGQLYVRERWLRADLAIIKAWRADNEGSQQSISTQTQGGGVGGRHETRTARVVSHLSNAHSKVLSRRIGIGEDQLRFPTNRQRSEPVKRRSRA